MRAPLTVKGAKRLRGELDELKSVKRPAVIAAIAAPKLRPTPITSPVERISGPRIGSTPWNLANGKIASLTEK